VQHITCTPHALYSEVNAEARAAEIDDLEHEQPGIDGKIVGVCFIVIGVFGVVLVYIAADDSVNKHVREEHSGGSQGGGGGLHE
jgi:hypothetical protein